MGYTAAGTCVRDVATNAKNVSATSMKFLYKVLNINNLQILHIIFWNNKQKYKIHIDERIQKKKKNVNKIQNY